MFSSRSGWATQCMRTKHNPDHNNQNSNQNIISRTEGRISNTTHTQQLILLMHVRKAWKFKPQSCSLLGASAGVGRCRWVSAGVVGSHQRWKYPIGKKRGVTKLLFVASRCRDNKRRLRVRRFLIGQHIWNKLHNDWLFPLLCTQHIWSIHPCLYLCAQKLMLMYLLLKATFDTIVKLINKYDDFRLWARKSSAPLWAGYAVSLLLTLALLSTGSNSMSAVQKVLFPSCHWDVPSFIHLLLFLSINIWNSRDVHFYHLSIFCRYDVPQCILGIFLATANLPGYSV